MLSKQKTNKLFNDQYNRRTENISVVIGKKPKKTAHVKITSIRIKHSKYFRIKLPVKNPLKKPYIKLNINTIPRPNYKNGSLEMYRMVNGLCQYCGHKEFNGEIRFSKNGYELHDISCTKCHNTQPWDYIHIYTDNNQENRGKSYAERKKKKKKSNSHPKKNTNKRKIVRSNKNLI